MRYLGFALLAVGGLCLVPTVMAFLAAQRSAASPQALAQEVQSAIGLGALGVAGLLAGIVVLVIDVYQDNRQEEHS